LSYAIYQDLFIDSDTRNKAQHTVVYKDRGMKTGQEFFFKHLPTILFFI